MPVPLRGQAADLQPLLLEDAERPCSHSHHGHAHGHGHGHRHGCAPHQPPGPPLPPLPESDGAVVREAAPAQPPQCSGGHGHDHSRADDAGHAHAHKHAHAHEHSSPPRDAACTHSHTAPRLQPPGAEEAKQPLVVLDSSGTGGRGSSAERALMCAVALSASFMVAEVAGGLLAHSVAILSDAAHLLCDVAAMGLALATLRLSRRPRTHSSTYGHSRAEVIGAFVSLLSIWFLTILIVGEAGLRLIDYARCAGLSPAALARDSDCRAVDGRIMLAIGLGGLGVNVLIATVLWAGNAAAHVQHMHSHGADGACPSGGHSHSHGHSHVRPHKKVARDQAVLDITAELTAVRGEGASPCSHSHAGGHSHGSGGCEGKSSKGKLAKLTEALEGEDVNVKGAMVHAIGDCLQSLGVVLAAAVIWVGNLHTQGTATSTASWYNIADPCITFVFAAITVFTTKGLLRQVLRVLMESAPAELDARQLQQELEALPGVLSVHDLHVWSLTLSEALGSVHLVAASGATGLPAAARRVFARCGVRHVTVEVEADPGVTCPCACPPFP
eukprot:TRINITY_DN34_c0_g1_i1.p1 TRINITY_DN34_c0_g1~~TRINITY_DN34_c0_g1_i1.p1  ORF type:complete len:556 (+),score=131.78 TRINITY_DN34_c0_g1_i1:80-1747(+)